MTTTKTTPPPRKPQETPGNPRKPQKTQAFSRLRALGQGGRAYCLDQDRTSYVPSASRDGSTYQVQVRGETMLCHYAAGCND